MITIYKTLTFDSAHQLKGHSKCGKIHGHTFRVEIWLTGKTIKPHNFILDFHEIKNYFNQFDHSGKILTLSAEDFATKTGKHFLSFKNIEKVKVKIWETSTACAIVELE